ncbi:MAG: class I SAM-dependent methyltransferase [Roseiflexaceae bacterium]|nr:class I SAM-dependent methyltransferase [Roseiflexaceae bacterium]
MSTNVLPPPDQKAEYVERMFSRIAPGYDMMNGIMTLGMDRGWRAATVALAAPPSCGRALERRHWHRRFSGRTGGVDARRAGGWGGFYSPYDACRSVQNCGEARRFCSRRCAGAAVCR